MIHLPCVINLCEVHFKRRECHVVIVKILLSKGPDSRDNDFRVYDREYEFKIQLKLGSRKLQPGQIKLPRGDLRIQLVYQASQHGRDLYVVVWLAEY